MRVLFCSYQTVANPGGGVFRQILCTRDYLERLEVNVELFDFWKTYNWSEIDLVHVFETDMRNYFLLKMLPEEVPLVVSPIIDKTFPPVVARLLTVVSKRLPAPLLTSYKSHALAFGKADIVIARSRDERRMLKKGFSVPSQRIRYVPNGVDKKFLYADSELFISKYGLKDFVLYVGQIGNPRKNLHRLLKVAQRLEDIPFVLIGPILETPYAQRVLSMAEKISNVHVLGKVSEEELISAYAACGVFVLPSLVEGTGLVALEAGLAGAKVVVTNRGGPPDYFSDGGILIEPTVESIQRGIIKALNMPRSDLLQKKIMRDFLWDTVAEKLVGIYKEVIE